jgi:hypothetical protein
VLRRIFGHKRDELRRGLKILQDKEPHNMPHLLSMSTFGLIRTKNSVRGNMKGIENFGKLHGKRKPG